MQLSYIFKKTPSPSQFAIMKENQGIWSLDPLKPSKNGRWVAVHCIPLSRLNDSVATVLLNRHCETRRYLADWGGAWMTLQEKIPTVTNLRKRRLRHLNTHSRTPAATVVSGGGLNLWTHPQLRFLRDHHGHTHNDSSSAGAAGNVFYWAALTWATEHDTLAVTMSWSNNQKGEKQERKKEGVRDRLQCFFTSFTGDVTQWSTTAVLARTR